MKTEIVIRYGSAARHNRGAYTGAKVHRLICDVITELTAEEIEAARKTSPRRSLHAAFLRNRERGVETYWSVRPACGCTSGQHAGLPHSSLTAADVTCDKCKPA